jgi:hypothetical protein
MGATLVPTSATARSSAFFVFVDSFLAVGASMRFGSRRSHGRCIDGDGVDTGINDRRPTIRFASSNRRRPVSPPAVDVGFVFDCHGAILLVGRVVAPFAPAQAPDRLGPEACRAANVHHHRGTNTTALLADEVQSKKAQEFHIVGGLIPNRIDASPPFMVTLGSCNKLGGDNGYRGSTSG